MWRRKEFQKSGEGEKPKRVRNRAREGVRGRRAVYVRAGPSVVV